MTLIPAYKTTYLPELMDALLRQTRKPDLVVFSDDSPGQVFADLVSSPAFAMHRSAMEIRVIPGPRRGAVVNVRHLVQHWAGQSEMAHFLFDDDIIYPTFYAQHEFVHRMGEHGCSISKRWTANEIGQPQGVLPLPDAVSQHPHRMLSIDASVAFASIIPAATNWFGELSNMVFADTEFETLASAGIAGIGYAGLEDIGGALAVSAHRPVCYLNEPLGYFRVSAAQNTSNLSGVAMRLAHVAWLALALSGVRLGVISKQQALPCLHRMGQLSLLRYAEQPEMRELIEPITGLAQGDWSCESSFVSAWTSMCRFMD